MGAKQSRRRQPRWAKRIAPEKVRALYRSERAGLLDDGLLQDVGWALWARARDVAKVSIAMLEGRIECPQCGGEAQRVRQANRESTGATTRPVSCPACGYEGQWRQVREALRHHPRCLDCAIPLEWSYRDQTVTCPSCDRTLPYRTYRQRIKGRKRLPCPRCQSRLTQPPWESPQASVTPGQPERPNPPTAKPRRQRDIARCGRCGWEASWASLKRTWRGQRLQTGAGVPACERFVEEWPTCRDAGRQMLLVDAFLHELHVGPLAPLFIAASDRAVMDLLDGIGGIDRSTPRAAGTPPADRVTRGRPP